ncbi:DNA segregation ATPase FtsK/SpoIIIE, S-DNA-T family [Sphingobacterium nematocida]|uniref:DNA segregation ATPase FtsK/SpoIIIE, S-DNA-T family n=1 Tax=Sphingobacterium nematocida TaxID=1513896 RepID=A0A1T5BJ01_9SPHI|nr:DNA translocase FtsK [Sphingobacterium nematocida]SKB46989.1 DNA segregation ATPase FtsK/SpoIIIE, S-DNA-T family [Sphingobacterium nematocida]
MAYKGNTFKNSSQNRGSKETKETATISRKKTPSLFKSFDNIDFSEGQRKALKILGLFLILSSFLLAVAFTSYLFTWKEDQSYIAATNGGWGTLFDTSEELRDEISELPIVENKLGKLGALLANQFIFEWFGIASFLFILILFVVGYKLLYKKSILPVWKTILYASVGIIFLSVTLGFIQEYITETPHILEGKFGFWTNQLLNAQIGKYGVGGLLIFAYLTALILIYNLDLKFTFQSASKSSDNQEADEEELLSRRTTIKKEPIIIQEKEEQEEENIDGAVIEVSNTLRNRNTTPLSTSLNDRYAHLREEHKESEREDLDLDDLEEENSINFETKPTFEIPIPSVEDKSIELTVDTPLEIETNKEEEVEEPTLFIEKQKEEKPISANDLVAQFGEYDPKLDLSSYQHPTLDLLKDYGTGKITINQQELEANKNRIVDTLRNYNIEIEHIKATIGPTVTLYEIIPKPGVRISKIKNLEDDIALSLAALGIRIIAPMPGKGTIGIEVPNSTPEMVSMRSVLATEKFQKTDMDLPIALGKTISNEVYIADLAKMPHLLVAGATGQGKSVGINAILTSLLYKKHPAELKFVLVDPKKVELSLFKKVERHFLAKLPNEEEAIITDTKKVINTLNSLCIEMDQRYDLLKNAQVRNLKEYNAKFVNRRLNPEEGHRFLPFIVLIVDEFADLMMTAGKEVETPIARLAQLARAVGIHLVIATQRPSVNIITGTIKANFPARLAFRVLSKVDSRTILDSGGADQLIGRGDMLLATGSDLIRIQCAFVDTPEVEGISDFIGGQRGYPSAFMLPEYIDESGEGSGSMDFDLSDRDQLFEDAARLIVMHQQGSTSLIQRKLKLGYNRAGRIIDQLEAAGIVGPFEGSKAREVLYPDEYSLEQYLESLRKEN